MNTEKEQLLFWYEDPNILLNQKYIFEFFPTEQMSYKQQLNAITRTIIILTVIIMLINPSFRAQYYASLRNFSPEPRLGLKYNITEKFRIKAASGLYSQNLISAWKRK